MTVRLPCYLLHVVYVVKNREIDDNKAALSPSTRHSESKGMGTSHPKQYVSRFIDDTHITENTHT